MMHVRVDVPPIPACLEALAEGLVLLNVELLRYAEEHDLVMPPLYDTDIVYRREPVGREWWETASDLRGVVQDRSGDCEDLSASRAAELRYYEGDNDARVRVVPTKHGSYHAIVERSDGTIEDPSYIMLELESERTGVPMTELARRTTTDRRYT